MLEKDGEPVGFFPYQRDRHNIGRPVGGPFSDFQGLIVGSDVDWDPPEILRGCGLSAWHFDRLIASQQPFRPYHWVTNGSPYSGPVGRLGSIPRRTDRRAQDGIRSTLSRKLRTAQKKVGEVRLEYHSADNRVFAALIDWKRQQFRRTKVPDVLAPKWANRPLGTYSRPAERGICRRALLAVCRRQPGGDLLWHAVVRQPAWLVFGVQRPSLPSFRPGLLLWIELARASDGLGIRRIELGEGPEGYKSTFKSGSASLAEGSVDLRPIPRVAAANVAADPPLGQAVAAGKAFGKAGESVFPHAELADHAMKILLCHNYYQQPGGEDQVFADEAGLLRSNGHEVVQYTVHNDAIQPRGAWKIAGQTLWNRRTYRRSANAHSPGASRPDALPQYLPADLALGLLRGADRERAGRAIPA